MPNLSGSDGSAEFPGQKRQSGQKGEQGSEGSRGMPGPAGLLRNKGNTRYSLNFSLFQLVGWVLENVNPSIYQTAAVKTLSAAKINMRNISI